MILDHCDWSNPGADPYSGTFIEWVQTLPHEQRAQMLVLQERIERRVPDYDAVVYVDDRGISDANGREDYAYHDNILYMAFGNKGTLCRQVTRKNWQLYDVQSGMVFCNQNICAVRWSICNNWSIITREPVRQEPAPKSFESGYVAPVVAPPPAKEVGSEPSTPGSNSFPEGGFGYAYWGGGGGFGYGYVGGWGGGSYPCPTCTLPCPPDEVLPPPSPIPEPGTYALLAAGLGLLAFYKRRSRK